MCLYIKKNQEIKVATERIVAYKVLAVLSDGSYATAFRNVSVKLGGKYKAQGFIDRRCRHLHKESKFRSYGEYIGGGVIHTFKNLEDAKKIVKSPLYWFPSKLVIVKAYIPKGSEYYEGIFESTGIPSYGSREVRYSKAISHEITL